MLHYRAALSELKLCRSLWSNDARVRYCSGCRDLSVQLAQDDVSIWAGTASRAIKQLAQTESAALCIYIRDQDGSIAFFNPEISRLKRKLTPQQIEHARELIDDNGEARHHVADLLNVDRVTLYRTCDNIRID